MRISNHGRLGLSAATLITLSLSLSGCASGSHASKGAAQGAKSGAVAGAVGGLVSALVFGGDPVDRAARGAVYGGTTGAVAGAMSGAQRDKAERQRAEGQLAAYRQQIGDAAFDGLAALADCDYDQASRQATLARASENPNYRLAGLWLEVLSHADRRDEAAARELFPTLVAQDWDIKNESEAEAEMRTAVNDLMDIRERYGLPRVCGQ
jgi:hypothetical protein